MKLLSVLLLCSAALVAAQEVQQVDPASTSGSCYQMPTCETPPGTDGWMQCMFPTAGTIVRVCTAVCNQPYFKPSPNDPTTSCTTTGGWKEPEGSCTPTTENCVNKEPPSSGGTIGDWRCTAIPGGDYAKRCLGACLNNYTPANGELPAAHCNRYSGKWEITGFCVEPSCTATPSFSAPSDTIGWTDCRSVGDVYTCTAPCKPGYVPNPSAPMATCSKASGSWTGITGDCTMVKQCTNMPPADTNPRPSNSLGWSVSNCRTIGDQYFCTAECRQGFSGSPTASCDKTTGEWSATSGTCRRDNGNKCTKMPPPGTPVPSNSEGWTASGCSLVSATSYLCTADCRQGFFGTPIISCDPRTGFWSGVEGSCRDRPSSGCSGTPVSGSGTPFPDPSGSEGWDVDNCFTSSGRYTCQAPCKPGFEPVGSIPFSICTSPPGSSSSSWSSVQGRCKPSDQVSCTNTPPFAAPRNTIGWQQQYCQEINEQYICTAYCASGYKQGSDGLPSSSCDIMTGQWTGVGGSCVPGGGGGGCDSLPDSNPPKNSLGWRKTACYTTGFGPMATTTCYATCDAGYTGSGASGYDPYATCNWKTGQWSSVNGFCIPENGGGGECDAGYPNVPEPPNTYGWSCSTMGWGPYVQRVCTASCEPGYYGFPCAPSISCTGSGSWSDVKGGCVPYEQSQPCWGYPGGKPTCYGGKAKWRNSCGGAGYCYKSRTYAKNCGSRCNLYCPSHVKHNTRCTAPCSGGTSGFFYSTCINGKWTTIGGGCSAK